MILNDLQETKRRNPKTKKNLIHVTTSAKRTSTYKRGNRAIFGIGPISNAMNSAEDDLFQMDSSNSSNDISKYFFPRKL